jgi:transposase-like protein
VDGQEVSLPSWREFASEDPLDERVANQMVLGVATRRYERSLEALPPQLRSRGTSKSSVSRRFVSATQSKLEDLLTRDLSALDLLVLMLDGIQFADHVVLVGLGISRDGSKHVLGLQEGASENAAACEALLTSLRDRGLRTNRSILVTVDGSKALAKAVRDVFGERALAQRCQVHKKRNVLDHLPESLRASVGLSLTQAYRSRDAKRARRLLLNLSRSLEIDHPGAAASIREGLDETLTVKDWGLPDVLERMLSTTNAIENLLGMVRHVSRRVKNWQGGTMILRWMAAGLEEAAKGFRRVRGYKGLVKLEEALRDNDRRIDESIEEVEAA